MASGPNPELIEKWKPAASAYLHQQKKMRQEREKLQAQLAMYGAQARSAEAEGRREAQTYFGLGQEVVQRLLHQLDGFDLEDDNLTAPTPAALAAVEMLMLEAQFYRLRMDQLDFDRLYRLVSPPKTGPLGVKPATGPLGKKPATGPLGARVADVVEEPEIWRKIKAGLEESPAWREAIERFRADYPLFKDAVSTAVPLFEQLIALPPGPDRLSGLKEIGVPALLGQHYRLEALFRPLPDGEALIDQVRVKPKAGLSAEPDGKGRKLTNRLKAFFNQKDS